MDWGFSGWRYKLAPFKLVTWALSCRGRGPSPFQVGSWTIPFLVGDMDRSHAGRLHVRPDTPSPTTPSGPPNPYYSASLELATWALAAPGKFFEPEKFARHLNFPHLFTFKLLTMS